jgi:hypothetical protein
MSFAAALTASLFITLAGLFVLFAAVAMAGFYEDFNVVLLALAQYVAADD